MKIQPIPSAARHYSGCAGVRQRGFMLIELIMVMVMLGVLAVFAAPRIFNSDDFYARGFHDETLGLLRYAQKAAIAQRRSDCGSCPTTRVVATSACATLPTPSPTTFDGGIGVTVTCSRTDYPEALTNRSIYQFTSVASKVGSIGYMARSLSASMEGLAQFR